uniref:DNA-directed RNA polymerase subunit beta n=1 Tax=Cololejeunea lanciloba TaxID=1186967 RepID=A0A4Y5P564_9MARC|nr:RNA polymerase beta subunit [Cololejeunea lanciloba]QCW58408.1 RNA polymerase beta subunit [Cololejeunea lanciloba]
MKIFVLPEFGKIQFQSFNRFLNKGLIEELIKFPKIEDIDQELEFRIFGEKYQLTEPFIKERDAVYQSITYSSDLYVPAQLKQKKEGNIQKQTVFLGSIPLMNSQGTFIVNGIARVVINQILRSPGIYYNSELDRNRIPIYTGTLISNWGGRLKLEIDVKRRIWARISKKRKVSIFVLLSAMGLNLEKILINISYPSIFLKSIIKKTKKEQLPSTEEAIIELYKQLYSLSGDIIFSESIRRELQKKFFQQRFEIGKTGRLNLNKKFDLNIPEHEIFLLPQDILAAVNYLIKSQFGMGKFDDIDHLKNKRVCSVADLLQDQLKLALNRLENSVRQIMRGANKRKRLPTPKSLITPTPVITTFKEFFGSHPLSQFLDQTNPLTEMVHKRRLSSLGPGGLTRRTAGFQVRDIHPSHYGRICPIETSEGMNAGLIGSLAIHAQINYLGGLESPFYKISEMAEVNNKIHNISAGEDEYHRIAIGNRLALDQNSRENQITPVRYRQDFVAIAWEQVHLRSIFPLQYFSVGASLIPFLEHNDANRALMGSNMQRQAVPLLKTEKCIVGTGIESQIALDSGSIIVSMKGGKIHYIDNNKITLSVNTKLINTNLIVYQRSNNNTCIHQKPQVKKDKYIKKGQILADGSATSKGELALGKNILVAYMPWEGYNFEDAILINERLIYDDIYTSLHIEKYEIEARVTSEGAEKFTREIPHLDSYLLRHLDKNGFVSTGAWVETGDVLVGKLTPHETEETLRAPEGKLLQAIFGIQVAHSKETSLKVPIGGKGRVLDVRSIYREDGSNDTKTIHVYILQKRKIQTGDKIAGRHGNKGIVSKILPRQDMPFLQNGIPIDMILSPLGVPSRMNVGQIFECLLGLAGEFLNKNYRITPFDERYEQESSRKLVFSELFKASEKTKNPWLFEPDNPGKSRLFDGRTGEAFEQPITIGKAYMLKLIHQVDDKIHARSSGPYALVTQQPLRGRSRKGGQRVGEMEVWALEGFGVAYILQEMLTIKSDHIQARYEVLGAIVTGEPIPKPKTAPESFKLLVRELRSLALEINYATLLEKDLGVQFKEI